MFKVNNKSTRTTPGKNSHDVIRRLSTLKQRRVSTVLRDSSESVIKPTDNLGFLWLAKEIVKGKLQSLIITPLHWDTSYPFSTYAKFPEKKR